MAGHFIVAGFKGVYIGLNKSLFDRIARDIGIDDIHSKDGPSDLFKSGQFPECK